MRFAKLCSLIYHQSLNSVRRLMDAPFLNAAGNNNCNSTQLPKCSTLANKAILRQAAIKLQQVDLGLHSNGIERFFICAHVGRSFCDKLHFFVSSKVTLNFALMVELCGQCWTGQIEVTSSNAGAVFLQSLNTFHLLRSKEPPVILVHSCWHCRPPMGHWR